MFNTWLTICRKEKENISPRFTHVIKEDIKSEDIFAMAIRIVIQSVRCLALADYLLRPVKQRRQPGWLSFAECDIIPHYATNIAFLDSRIS